MIQIEINCRWKGFCYLTKNLLADVTSHLYIMTYLYPDCTLVLSGDKYVENKHLLISKPKRQLRLPAAPDYSFRADGRFEVYVTKLFFQSIKHDKTFS